MIDLEPIADPSEARAVDITAVLVDLRGIGEALIMGHVARFDTYAECRDWSDEALAFDEVVRIGEAVQSFCVTAWGLVCYPVEAEDHPGYGEADWRLRSWLRLRTFVRETMNPRVRIVVVEASTR